MAMNPTKRKKMETLIYEVFNKLDPTGTNTNKYRAKFHDMSDAQFDAFFKQFFNNDKEYLTLDIVEYERGLDIDKIEDAAKVLNIPLFEDLYMPHLTMDKDNVICAKYQCAVGYLNIKRPQQMVHKKNGLSISNNKRSSLTGQVSASDKNGRESDMENSMLLVVGANDILREMNGPRADDMVMKNQMNTAINTNGYVSLDQLENDPSNKTALNTIDVFMLGMGLKTDLVTSGLMLKRTIKDQT